MVVADLARYIPEQHPRRGPLAFRAESHHARSRKLFSEGLGRERLNALKPVPMHQALIKA